MAFTVGFKQGFLGPVDSTGWLRTQLADQTATTAVTNTGIVGLQWARVRIRMKTIGTLVATDEVTITLIVGTGAAITAPEAIGQVQYTVTALGETTFNMNDLNCWSQNGFQSFKLGLTYSAAHTGTFDIQVDVM
jgi:hypothetical protein